MYTENSLVDSSSSYRPNLDLEQLFIHNTLHGALAQVGKVFRPTQNTYFKWLSSTNKTEFIASQAQLLYFYKSLWRYYTLCSTSQITSDDKNISELLAKACNEKGLSDNFTPTWQKLKDQLRAMGASDYDLDTAPNFRLNYLIEMIESRLKSEGENTALVFLLGLEYSLMKYVHVTTVVLKSKNWCRPDEKNFYNVDEYGPLSLPNYFTPAFYAWDSGSNRKDLAKSLLYSNQVVWQLYESICS